MAKEKDTEMIGCKCRCKPVSGCGVYSLGFLGALIYFIQQATGFQSIIIGLFKTIFWPAIVIYKVLELLKI